MSNTEKPNEYLFSQETINSLSELGKVLEGIYMRMKSEGYDIIDGRIIHLETGKEYEPPKRRQYQHHKRD